MSTNIVLFCMWKLNQLNPVFATKDHFDEYVIHLIIHHAPAQSWIAIQTADKRDISSAFRSSFEEAGGRCSSSGSWSICFERDALSKDPPRRAIRPITVIFKRLSSSYYPEGTLREFPLRQ